MKIKITLFLLLCAFLPLGEAQVPQGFNYQSVMRNAQNNPLLNSPIGVRFTITEASTSAVLYTETHSVLTNTFGLASLVIGKGTVQSGTFSTINWATPKKLVVGIDPAGGTNYSLTSTSDLQSVPFALSSQTAVTAQTATNATNATNAVNAQTAVTAQTATNATNATNAVNAQTAVTAQTATNATNATNAVNAQNLISNVLTINSSTQKIGIGNTSPAGKLTINHDDDGTNNSPSLLLQTTRTADYSRIRMANTNRAVGKMWDIAGYNAPLAADSRLSFWYSDANTSGTNKFTIAGDGKIGFGTDNIAGAAVTIENDDTYDRPTLLVRGKTSGVFAYTRIRMANADTRFWDISAFGSANDGRFELIYNNGTVAKSMFTFDRVGNGWAFGSFINSDRNLKRDIQPLGQSLPILLQLGGYRYHWKDEALDPTIQIGFIAQELEKLYPELIRTNEKGLKAVNYIGLIPVVVTAIKEQQQQIEDLKKEVAELKAGLTRLLEKR